MRELLIAKAYRFCVCVLALVFCITAFSGISYRDTYIAEEWNTGVYPTLNAEERAQLSEALAAMAALSAVANETPSTLGIDISHLPEAAKSEALEFDGPISLEHIAEPAPWYTDWEWEITAIIIYQEMGGDAASDLSRLAVGNVFINRVLYSEHFPDSFEEVATQYGQYGTLYWTGIQWPARAQNPGEAHAVERAREIAKRVLDGERVFAEDVIWQAEFPQGTEIVLEIDGMYFCR